MSQSIVIGKTGADDFFMTNGAPSAFMGQSVGAEPTTVTGTVSDPDADAGPWIVVMLFLNGGDVCARAAMLTVDDLDPKDLFTLPVDAVPFKLTICDSSGQGTGETENTTGPQGDPGGEITNTGSADVLTKSDAEGNLVDSIISDDDTTATVTGALEVTGAASVDDLTATGDTSLKNTEIDGDVTLLGQLQTDQTAAGDTPGSVIASLAVYDEAGVLIGYLPIYDEITVGA